MADFTGNDINDAKRRVEEMRRRSQSFVENENNGKKKMLMKLIIKRKTVINPKIPTATVFSALFFPLSVFQKATIPLLLLFLRSFLYCQKRAQIIN